MAPLAPPLYNDVIFFEKKTCTLVWGVLEAFSTGGVETEKSVRPLTPATNHTHTIKGLTMKNHIDNETLSEFVNTKFTSFERAEIFASVPSAYIELDKEGNKVFCDKFMDTVVSYLRKTIVAQGGDPDDCLDRLKPGALKSSIYYANTKTQLRAMLNRMHFESGECPQEIIIQAFKDIENEYEFDV